MWSPEGLDGSEKEAMHGDCGLIMNAIIKLLHQLSASDHLVVQHGGFSAKLYQEFFEFNRARDVSNMELT